MRRRRMMMTMIISFRSKRSSWISSCGCGCSTSRKMFFTTTTTASTNNNTNNTTNNDSNNNNNSNNNIWKRLKKQKQYYHNVQLLFNAAKEGNLRTFKKYIAIISSTSTAATATNTAVGTNTTGSSSRSSSNHVNTNHDNTTTTIAVPNAATTTSTSSATITDDDVDDDDDLDVDDDDDDDDDFTMTKTIVAVDDPYGSTNNFDTSSCLSNTTDMGSPSLATTDTHDDTLTTETPSNTTTTATTTETESSSSTSTTTMLYFDTIFRCPTKDSTRNTILHVACQKNRMNIVQYIYQKSLLRNMNSINRYGKTALHISCQYGHVQITKYLIEICNVNIDACNNRYHLSPLLYATLHGRMGIVRYLTDSSMSITKQRPYPLPLNYYTKDSRGYNILHYATMNGQLDLLQYITQYWNDYIINKLRDEITTDTFGYTILHTSTIKNGGRLSIIKYCIEELDCNPVTLHDNDGNTILHHLIRFSTMRHYHPKHHYPIIQYLIEEYEYGNMLLHVRNYNQQTPYELLMNEELDSGEVFFTSSQSDSKSYNSSTNSNHVHDSERQQDGKQQIAKYIKQQMYRMEVVDGNALVRKGTVPTRDLVYYPPTIKHQKKGSKKIKKDKNQIKQKTNINTTTKSIKTNDKKILKPKPKSVNNTDNNTITRKKNDPNNTKVQPVTKYKITTTAKLQQQQQQNKITRRKTKMKQSDSEE